MTKLVADPAFQIYIATTLILGMNLLVLANNTALTRASAGEVINPEDRKLNAEADVVFEAGNEATFRYRRAHRNALENIPLFLITGLLLVLVGTSPLVAGILFGIFTVARVTHSVCYIKQIQPFRTASFAIGALDQVALLGFLGWGTFMA